MDGFTRPHPRITIPLETRSKKGLHNATICEESCFNLYEKSTRPNDKKTP